jgi:hypothetical protein
MDRNLEHQHRLTELPFAVVVVIAKSNRIGDLQLLVADILAALGNVEAGTVQHVGA